MTDLIENLREEIQFWHELMLESGLDLQSKEYQRMQNAMDLAKMKLNDVLASGNFEHLFPAERVYH